MIEHFNKAQIIFNKAITLESGLIDDYLLAECGDNSALIKTVISLLESHRSLDENTEVKIETQLLKLLSTATELKKNITPKNIEFKSNRYKVIKKIGDGGMASVFLCSREHDGFTQNVAIKLLNNHEYSTATIQRFKLEKQILAQLDHPNISQFIDTDYLTDDTPFVVIEYTPGLTITDFCQKNNLSVQQKLELFMQLCGAVKHAHQNLVIHRDIKPSNILVTEEGLVKLIDFGIAKDISGETELNTQTGIYIMTPAYASPEQIFKKPLSTLTDLYSLGIVLYELLTSSRPFDLSKLSSGQYEKLLLEEEIEPPSKRAINQQHVLKGDLDAIVLKAIKTDIKTRYSSISELMDDIKRYQGNVPVIARNPNFIYNTTKFIKRNRVGVISTVIFCLISALFLTKIIQEQHVAEQERIKANTISNSFILAFKNADPTQTLGESTKAVHVMDQVALNMTQNHAESSLLLEEFSLIIAEVYYNLGSYEKALEFVMLNKNNAKLASQDIANEWLLLEAKIQIKTEAYDDAMSTLSYINSGKQDQLHIASFYKAKAMQKKGDGADAIIILDELTNQVDSRNPLFSEICLTRFNLEYEEVDLVQQKNMLDQCLSDQTFLNNKQSLINNEVNLRLARSFQSKSLFDDSNEYYLSSLEITKSIYGEQHISQISAFKGLGWNYKMQKKFEESILFQNKALKISEKYHGIGHPNTTNAIFNLGHVYSDMEDFEKALEQYNSAINIMLVNGQSETKKLAFYYKSIGHLQNNLGSYTEAVNNIKNSIRIFNLKQGGYHYRAAEMQVLLSHIYYNQENYNAAREELASALPNMYTMHKSGDYYQVLAEELDAKLNGKPLQNEFTILLSE